MPAIIEPARRRRSRAAGTPKRVWGRRRGPTVAFAAVVGLGAIGAVTPVDGRDLRSGLKRPSGIPGPAHDQAGHNARPDRSIHAAAPHRLSPRSRRSPPPADRCSDGDRGRLWRHDPGSKSMASSVRSVHRHGHARTGRRRSVRPGSGCGRHRGQCGARRGPAGRSSSATSPTPTSLIGCCAMCGSRTARRLSGESELVRSGHGLVFDDLPTHKYADPLVEDERLAQAAERGVSGAWPTPSPTVATVVAVDGEPRYTHGRSPPFRGRGRGLQLETRCGSKRILNGSLESAPSAARCRIAWQIQPEAGSVIKRTVRVEPGDEVTGNAR